MLTDGDKLWLEKNMGGGEPKYQMTYMNGPINVTVRLDDKDEVVGAIAELVKQARENTTIVAKIKIPSNGTTPDRTVPATDAKKCPKCDNDMWDNRPKKATGDFKKNGPDFKCKKCEHVIWPPKKQ